MAEKTYRVVSDNGIQAQPAAQLVNLASQFDADIFLKYKSKTVNLKSIMVVMFLAIGKGSEIIITTKGKGEQEALQKIDHFITSELENRPQKSFLRAVCLAGK